ncbi:hypothetical protein [Burkholderia mayonis]|uniref:hypothetical protein n=1 Tax=Burkholderia mayonis TaxID=1385591 RepID=UPI00131F1236|nr:hypothetical protein [Burkholderia mayonis]
MRNNGEREFIFNANGCKMNRSFRGIVTIVGISTVLFGCATNYQEGYNQEILRNSETYQSILSVRGPEASHQLTEWYGKKDVDCGNRGRPAFLCSGVMLRATETNPAFLPWDPSQGAIARGGTSFSWLRSDNNFSNLVFGYHNGYILYPTLYVPYGKKGDIQVFCAYTMDADTFNRPTQQGCGPSTAYPNHSVPCENQGITTAAQWIAHFNSTPSKYAYQCSWGTRENQQDAADHFYQNILARNLMDMQWWPVQNEIMLQTWATGIGATLPIHSFFYQLGFANALANAKTDQRRYFNSYREKIPIIRLELPSTKTGQAKFTYSNADQDVPTTSEETFEFLPIGPAGTSIRLRYFSVSSRTTALEIDSGFNSPPFLTGKALRSDDSYINFTLWPHSVKFGYKSVSGPITVSTTDNTGTEKCCITLRDTQVGEWFSNSADTGKTIKSLRIKGGIIIDNVSLVY